METPRFASTMLEIVSRLSSSMLSRTSIRRCWSQASISPPTTACREKRMKGCVASSSSGSSLAVSCEARSSSGSSATWFQTIRRGTTWGRVSTAASSEPRSTCWRRFVVSPGTMVTLSAGKSRLSSVTATGMSPISVVGTAPSRIVPSTLPSPVTASASPS